MLFTSAIFQVGFLPLVWVGFVVCARLSGRLSLAWLVAASLFFYGWWNPHFVLLLVVSVAANYLAGRAIAALRDRPARCHAVLTLAIAGDLGALIYYKYLFAVATFLVAHGVAVPQPGPVTLPLGISFFTFTQIAYLVDVAWGEANERDPVSYALFVTFFPHLLAGPILHHGEMMPQFRKSGRHSVNGRDTAVGVSLFVLGLAKKILIADMFAGSVDWGFAHTDQVQFFTAWKSALSYSVQLYFDFSGYSDMAIGLARMFGIRFPLNFNSPYKAASVIEYWQRWHMTLTRYLTQYLFNPMALAIMHAVSARRRRQGERMTRHDRFLGMVLVPMMATMAIAGAWHGAGLQYVVFGLLHGVYLSINHAWRIYGPASVSTAPAVTRAMSCLLTYCCVLVGAVFFRAASVTDGVQLLAGMAGWHGSEGALPVPQIVAAALGSGLSHLGLIVGADASTFVPVYLEVLALVVVYTIIWCMPNTQEMMARYRPALGWTGSAPRYLPAFRLNAVWGVVIGILATLAVSLPQSGEFIYFQF